MYLTHNYIQNGLYDMDSDFGGHPKYIFFILVVIIYYSTFSLDLLHVILQMHNIFSYYFN